VSGRFVGHKRGQKGRERVELPWWLDESWGVWWLRWEVNGWRWRN
jgi:hypothetical protein